MKENELLRRDLAIYVSNDFATKNKILRMNHDDFDAKHFVRVRTKNAIRRKYYWSNMIDDIAKYVRNCSNCQRVRVYYHYYSIYSEESYFRALSARWDLLIQ